MLACPIVMFYNPASTSPGNQRQPKLADLRDLLDNHLTLRNDLWL